MADYYPLVARAVAGLERNTGEARRALYERARTALVAQLRGVSPSLSEADITRERLGLEEAIRKVEMEAARRMRGDRPSAPPPSAAGGAAPARAPAAAPAGPQAVPEPPPPAPQPDIRHAPAPPPPIARPAPTPSLADEGLKGFRDVVGLPHSDAPPPRPQAQQPQHPQPSVPSVPPRDPFSGIPAAHDFDQLEPPIDAQHLRHPAQDFDAPYEPPAGQGGARTVPPEPDEGLPPARKPLPIGALVKVAISAVIILGLAGLVYWQRGTVMGLYRAFLGQPSQVARDNGSPSRPKISDRIGANPAAQSQSGATPAVAQRVVLYEEEANDPQGKRYIGSVIWKTETVSPGAGKPPDVGIRADVEVPERHLTMTFTLRRNSDQTLPASHTAEIIFNLPSDFSAGGISNVPGILMKQAEQTRGTPLSGLAVKVTTGYFLIGLSAVEADRQRNIELLKERSWFDIPIVYNNNRRAILALEKGTPGERVFAEAFAAWKQ